MELLEGSSLLTDSLEAVISRTKRPVCSGCGRPEGPACWCPHVPDPPVAIGRHKVVIVQHPSEGTPVQRGMPSVFIKTSEVFWFGYKGKCHYC